MDKKHQNEPVIPQRRQNRMAAVQYLYQWEANKPEQLNDGICQFFEHQEEHPRAYYAFAEELVYGVIENIDAVDAQIKQHAQNWTFERIAKVDLAVLRLALYELLYRTDIPPIVSINEAVELGKIFSNPDSKRFINGLLDKVKGHLNRPLRNAVD
jgi:N utilization substance protein B|tara:strand:+ start:513 stop:977 length:465 start_codon:yes stop_codon:yes gene_type:complete